ncbi:GNAT family N-acetyltransferase [Flavobacterium sp.]|jgi:GNAT superfamily N-acetyltransferase|uniref:GNAT family N-acetyltransferase n=1 Tax=Flavobacterium sp. TaxID=239 RepID=UPI002A81CCA6|nr:GNAT family N-acetyltransferase [Flavobacterium sp.]
MIKQFRKAEISEINQIWQIIKDAVQRRKEDGSNQWQDGYPNPEVLQNDIEKETGFVLTENDVIIGYCAILINDEPEYINIKGKWLTTNDFIVFHRVAIAKEYLGKGFAKIIFNHIEDFARSKNIYSVKADTNFDNFAMIALFEKMTYVYCGEVSFRGSPRKAYEKNLIPNN